MKRGEIRTGPSLALTLIVWVFFGSITVAETMNHVHVASKVAVDGMFIAIGAFLTWLIWVKPS